MCYCPTPKLSPHRRLYISTFPLKNSLCMIYKCFKLWGHWKCPHKSPSPCNTCHTHVIIQICVLINHINMHTHTQTFCCWYAIFFIWMCLYLITITKRLWQRISPYTHPAVSVTWLIVNSPNSDNLIKTSVKSLSKVYKAPSAELRALKKAFY